MSPANPLPPISGLVDIVTDPGGVGIRTITQSFVVPSAVTQATLSWSDRLQNFATVFQDPGQEFRVQILNSVGTVLQTVFSTNAGDPLTQTGPNNRSFDVTALLQSFAGQTLQLRFEEQDSLFCFNVSLDNINLSVQSASTVLESDLYAFNVDAGERVTLALDTTTGSGVNVELLNSGGVVIATGIGGPTNFDRRISNFLIAASGVYYARISSPATADYNLIVTQNAAFDTEANDSFALGQNISGMQGALGAITTGTTAAAAAVVTGSLATIEGNAGNAWPFHIGNFQQASMRYQQIYSSSEFTGAGIVDALRFRRDINQQAFSAAGIDLKINLSYAATSVATASATFANNIGGGVVTVFDGLLNLSSSRAGSPNPFDVVIDVANLFTYDPSQGNLLVDIFMRNSPITGFLDASGFGQQTATTRIFSFPGNVNATSGFVGTDTANTTSYGLVTKFDFANAPAEDWYSINVTSTANALRLETSTLADGPGELVNNLNPKIELYSPSNVLVASGNVLGDGRNEFINVIPTTAGTYRVRVIGKNSTLSEYFLSKNCSTVVSVVATSPIDENETATVTGTISDPDLLDAHTVVINWGPGEGSTTLTLPAGVTSFSAAHRYLDDNPSLTSSDPYPVSVTVTDSRNGGSAANTSVTVNNVAPQNVNAGADQTVNEGDLVSLLGSFTDPGVLDTHTQVWSVVASNGQSIPDGGGSSFTFIPIDNGTYTVTYTVTDDDQRESICDRDRNLQRCGSGRCY